MANSLKLCVLLLFFTLCSCQKVFETHYDYTSPVAESGQQCITQCQRVRDVCKRHCGVNPELCIKNEKAKSLKKYSSYVKERRRKGLPVTKDSNYFYNPLQCSKELCQCDSDYRACYELCGGQVHERQVCVKNCD